MSLSPPEEGAGRTSPYLARRALGPIQGWPLLGFAEVRVVRVAAPQLLAGIEGAELGSTEELGWDGSGESRRAEGTPRRPRSPRLGIPGWGGNEAAQALLTAVHVL